VLKQAGTEKTMSEISQQQPQSPYHDDEISLVDLATTLMRRRHVFYGVFALVIAGAIVFALARGQVPSTTYTTVIQLAKLPSLNDNATSADTSKNEIFRAESRMATLIATTNLRWLPEARERFEEQEEGWPGGLIVERVENTELLKLATTNSNRSKGNDPGAHKVLAGLIVDAQNNRLAQITALLESQITTMTSVLKAHGPDSMVAAQAIETRTRLQQMLATGESAEILSLATGSSDKASVLSMKLIFGLAIVVGLVLGIFATFMAEFGAQVRKAMREKA